MADYDRKEMCKELRGDEGEKLKAYRDSLGYWTAGVGHLIDPAKGGDPAPFGVNLIKGGSLTPIQSEALLLMDIEKKEKELDRRLPWWRKLSPVRQRVILNMAFNLGVEGLLEFKNTLALISVGHYQEASVEMLKSKWAKQVKGRATRLSVMMKNG